METGISGADEHLLCRDGTGGPAKGLSTDTLRRVLSGARTAPKGPSYSLFPELSLYHSPPFLPLCLSLTIPLSLLSFSPTLARYTSLPLLCLTCRSPLPPPVGLSFSILLSPSSPPRLLSISPTSVSLGLFGFSRCMASPPRVCIYLSTSMLLPLSLYLLPVSQSTLDGFRFLLRDPL